MTSFKTALVFRDQGFNLHDTMIWEKAGCQYPDKNRYNPCFEYMFVFSKGKPKTINLIADIENKHARKKINGRERGKDSVLREKIGACKGRVVKEYGVRSNVWKIPAGFSLTTTDKYAYEHPAMFPERLARDHILSWSNPGDVVLDPFIGSGTTAKMAVLTDRNYIGCDMSDKYCEIAKKRVADAILKKDAALTQLD